MADNNDSDTVSLYAVGDVGPDRDDPKTIFYPTAPFFRNSDIVFCQLERTFSERGSYQIGSGSRHSRVHPKNVDALIHLGVNVASFASNHCLDYGYEAFFDTINLLKQNNISVVGIGKNIDEARKPVVFERKKIRVAFLSYNAILPRGYAAEKDKPGCSPLRVKTFYEQTDWQPGTPPKIITFADHEDVEAMKSDIKKLRHSADIIVVSIHWGVHHIPAMVAMYQRDVGHAAIDAGADLILGHHAHILKGIEVYNGKVIFYSLCNFGFERSVKSLQRPTSHYLYGTNPDPEYPTYPWPAETRKTIVVKCLITTNGINRVSFLPAIINKQSQPEVLLRQDERREGVINYIKEIGKDWGANLSDSGDEVIVNT